jgi:hypothetical protein
VYANTREGSAFLFIYQVIMQLHALSCVLLSLFYSMYCLPGDSFQYIIIIVYISCVLSVMFFVLRFQIMIM